MPTAARRSGRGSGWRRETLDVLADPELVRDIQAGLGAGEPLRAPLDGLHAARRGEFRVIYRIDDERVTVLAVTIDHRRDVHRARELRNISPTASHTLTAVRRT